MATITLKGNEARDALAKGINELADVVVISLGPKGRNVAIDKRWSTPIVIHDGVTIAKAITPKDPFENMGAELIKEASSKTADVAGDGTTTAMLLAQSIINAGQEQIKNGANPMTLKKGIEKAASVVIAEIKKSAKTLTDKTETAQVATISAADPMIGNLIAEALERVGKTGVIAVEEGTSATTEVEYKEGMEFERGSQSPAFYTNTDKGFCEIENPYILFCDFALANVDEMATFLEKFVSTTKNKNIVFISDAVEGAALATLIMNGRGHRGAINTVAIMAPGIGDKRRELLEDMAILTGAKAAFKENGILLDQVPVEALGQADKIWCDANTTRIIGGKGDPIEVQKRVEALKTQLPTISSDFERDKLQERIAKLTGGVAVIKVGGQTEIQMRETKERVIDAVAATKAAVEEGIVAGGGVTLLKVREKILDLVNSSDGDEAIGMRLVFDALQEPIYRLWSNAGITKGKALIVDGKTGLNVETGEEVNMFDAGIIDPAKVTRLAVESAASVAAMILTTEACITEVPEDKKSPLEM